MGFIYVMLDRLVFLMGGIREGVLIYVVCYILGDFFNLGIYSWVWIKWGG